jgi:hypothetical protein
MEASRVTFAHVEVANNLVEITWDERDALLNRLRDTAETETIIDRFWSAGASRPVILNERQRLRLRVALERWGITVLPEGLTRLLIALVQADPEAKYP